MRARGFERGQVRVRVTVDARGTLVSLEAAAHVNGALDDQAGQCVQGVVRAASFTGCPRQPDVGGGEGVELRGGPPLRDVAREACR